MIGKSIYSLAEKLWPINRSLTGEGVRETLQHLQSLLPQLQIKEVPSGTEVFDWVIPKEWRISNAWIITPSGEKICDFKKNNLHVVGYSTSINEHLSLSELNNYLYSLPEQPDAIPYITSYYKERFGFCLTHNQRAELQEGIYQVYIDSELFDGNLTYGELIIPGESEKEVFISTYICHPSMANNELSGPCVVAHIGKFLSSEPRKYTYRIVFIPETIGSITYLSLNLETLKNNIFAGFNVSCVGDNRSYSYLPSRNGNSLSDVIAKHVLSHTDKNYKAYQWKDRGSDERQYCAPGIDLPIASIMRTKYGEYPEYHTSLDDLVNVVSADGLEGAYNVYKLVLEAIEKNCYPLVKVLCEPQLGKRGLYPTLSTKTSGAEVNLMMNLITWSDGTKSLIEIAELCNVPMWELYPIIDRLSQHNLLELLDKPF